MTFKSELDVIFLLDDVTHTGFRGYFCRVIGIASPGFPYRFDPGTLAHLVNRIIHPAIRGIQIFIPSFRLHQVHFSQTNDGRRLVPLQATTIAQGLDPREEVFFQPVTVNVLPGVTDDKVVLRAPRFFSLVSLHEQVVVCLRRVRSTLPIHPVPSDGSVETGFTTQVKIHHGSIQRNHALVVWTTFGTQFIAITVVPRDVGINGEPVLGVIHFHHLHGWGETTKCLVLEINIITYQSRQNEFVERGGVFPFDQVLLVVETREHAPLYI